MTTAPRFLLDPLPDGPVVVLDGPEGHHAATVRRLRPGEAVVLIDGHGRRRPGTVRGVGRDRLEISAGPAEEIGEPVPRLVVVQALAKGERGELAAELLTELGVDEIVPWQAARSVVQWRGERGERSRERWARAVREAAKQSRRDRVPVLAPTADRAGVVGRVGAAGAAFVLHEDAEGGLTRQPLPTDGEILLVVGPEGGLDGAELDAFTAAGATPVRLGPEVLRTSTAGAAALAALAVRAGRW